jgi:hypothetical protein
MPKRYRHLPTEIDALQWDGTQERATELYEWTKTPHDSTWRAQFVVLGLPSASQFLGEPMDRTPPVDAEVTKHRTMIDSGATAALFVAANEDWLGIKTGEWVAKDEAGFYPLKPDIFALNYRLTRYE